MDDLHRAAALPRRVLAALLDLLLPQRCAGCAGFPGPLCGDCRALLRRRPRPCAPRPGCPPALAAGPYAGYDRRVLLAYKEGGDEELATALGERLAAVYAASGWAAPDTLLVPVPGRGPPHGPHGPVTRLAHACLAEAGGVGGVAPVLRYRQRVRRQVGLGRAERLANRVGVLTAETAPPSVAGRAAVVVDDVLTTGATVAEATRALRAAGVRVVGAIVVAERLQEVSADHWPGLARRFYELS